MRAAARLTMQESQLQAKGKKERMFDCNAKESWQSKLVSLKMFAVLLVQIQRAVYELSLEYQHVQ